MQRNGAGAPLRATATRRERNRATRMSVRGGPRHSDAGALEPSACRDLLWRLLDAEGRVLDRRTAVPAVALTPASRRSKGVPVTAASCAPSGPSLRTRTQGA